MNNQQTQYRGQSPYKQAPQVLTQQEQTNAAYAQPSYNTQQDVQVQNIDPQEYSENYNTAVSELLLMKRDVSVSFVSDLAENQIHTFMKYHRDEYANIIFSLPY